MFKNFIIILCFFVFVPALISAPKYSNPWFAWRSLDYAKLQLNINDCILNNEQCVFSNETGRVVFNNGRRMAELDGITVWLNVAPETVENGKNWKVSAIDLDLLSLTMQAKSVTNPEKLTVMIDAGHGGDDSGAISSCGTLKEKDLTLDLALRTGKLLKKAGLKVLYTRSKDRTLSLNERSTAASKQKADLFVSIHANKASNTDACGIETFVLTPSGYSGTSANSPPRGWQIGNKNDYNSNLLGYTIQKALVGTPDTFDRGLKRQSFFVLRETYCPATLVEVGFLSNADDLKKLNCKKWRDTCAEKLFEGIMDYCSKVVSLEGAVATKRKRDAEANERWREYLAAKINKQTEADLNKPVVNEKMTAKITKKPTHHPVSTTPPVFAKAKPVLTPVTPSKSPVIAKRIDEPREVSGVDLGKLTESTVQSVATNIYLTKETNNQTAQQSGEGDLKALMDFYEKGSLN